MEKCTVKLMMEPRSSVYGALLDFALKHCDSALLVLKDDLGQKESCAELLKRMAPYLNHSLRASGWPGTVLIGRRATIQSYKLTEESVVILKGAVSGLFDWCQPDRPEDLCLLRPDKSEFMVTVTQERYAYFVASEPELAEIAARFPMLLPRAR